MMQVPLEGKYLINILVEQGIKEEDARDHLKKLFKTDLLEDVTKLQASEMIKGMLQGKGNNNSEVGQAQSDKNLLE